MNLPLERQRPSLARAQTVTGKRSRAGLQKHSPSPQQQQQVATERSDRVAPAPVANKIDYDDARARNGRELENSESAPATTTTAAFVIYENLNARRHRQHESCQRQRRREQQHGHLLLSPVNTKIATSQEQQSTAEWSRVVLPAQSSGRREEQPQQVASFECAAARQMRGSGDEQRRYSSKQQQQHFIKLQLRCQDVGGQQQEPIVVIDRQQEMKSSRQHSNRAQDSNYASPSIKSHEHLMNGAHELPLPPTASGGGGCVGDSPLSPLQNHHNHLLPGAGGGQTCSSTSAINSCNNTHTLNSHRSTRSTATDSSGFSSEASTTSCNRTSSSQQQQQVMVPKSASSSSLIRSRLIEDLNRLEKIAAAAKAQRAGLDPATTAACSVASTPAATLSRTSHVELDYSTLCRDEFSSFIAYQPGESVVGDQVLRRGEEATRPGEQVPKLVKKNKMNQDKRRDRGVKPRSARRVAATRGGPMLVGVHECETPGNELTARVPDSTRSVSSSASSASSISPSEASSPDQNNLNSGCSSSPVASLSTNSGRDLEYQEQFGDEDYDQGHEQEEAATTTPIDYKNNNHLLRRPHHEAQIEEYFSDESDNHHHHHDHEQEQNHLYESQEDRLSSLEGRSGTPISQQSADIEPPRPAYKLELNLLPKAGEDDKLSEMLDVYLSRVESLLRLAKGDKSIKLNAMSIGELDNGNNKSRPGEIEISEEFRTRIAYVPSPQRVDKLPEVIQELEVFEGHDQECDDEDQVGEEENSFFLTNIVSDNFKALLSSPQTSAKLNWWPNQLAAQSSGGDESVPSSVWSTNFIGERQRQLLEQSFLKKWLEQDQDHQGSQSSNKQKYYESLVKIVRKHMGEFVSNYNTYQTTMREETSFACDWHANWLFATTRTRATNLRSSQQQQVAMAAVNKRAKLMSPEPSSTRHAESCNQANASATTSELLNYSTLLLARYKPIKVAYVDDDDDEADDDAQRQEGVKYKRQIDTCYEQQPGRADELRQTFASLSGQVNVCQLMLNDSFADAEPSPCQDAHGNEGGERKPLEVSYESSLCAGRPMIDGQLMSFCAHGHLFELRRLRQFFNLTPPRHPMQTKRRKLEALRQLVLVRLARACNNTAAGGGGGGGQERKLDLVASHLPHRQVQRDQVRFLVHVSSVQVSQPLAVIQFCAKFTGALPIRVSWHKQLERGGQFNELTRASDDHDADAEWPLTMDANYELEYQNKWSSWYRFRRRQGEVLFEIREPSALCDYDQTYKCVIENYCSIRECEFTLQIAQCRRRRRREPSKSKVDNEIGATQPQAASKVGSKSRRLARSALGLAEKNADEIGKVRLNRVECNQGESREAGQAILRTWSQRTLNKRAPLVADTDRLEPLAEQSQQAIFASGQQSATDRRLPTRAAHDDCHSFGTNYPYHPVSLMKRLEENKMSLALGSRLRGLSSSGGTRTFQDDDDRYYDLTTEDQQEPPEPTGCSALKEVLEDTNGKQQQQQLTEISPSIVARRTSKTQSTSGQSPVDSRPAEPELPTPRPRQKPVAPPTLSVDLIGPNHCLREPLKEIGGSSTASTNQVARDDCATRSSRRQPVNNDDDGGENNYQQRPPSTGRCGAQEPALLCQSTPAADNDAKKSARHSHHSTFARTALKSAGQSSRAATLTTSSLGKPRWRRPSCDHDEPEDDGDGDGRQPTSGGEQQQKPKSEEIVKLKSVRSLISRFNMG